MTVQLNNYNAYTVNGRVITDLMIKLNANDLNYATFVYPEAIAPDTVVTIMYLNITNVFTGVVTYCRKLARTIDNRTQYEIELVEQAIELKNNYVSIGDYTGVYIKNSSTLSGSATLGWYVSNIIADLDGWTDSSAAVYRNMRSPPGVTNKPIPSIGFSMTTVWKALNRIVCTIFNYGLWFEYVNGSKRIIYGEYRKDIREFPKPVSISKIQGVENYNIDGIIVYGESNSLFTTRGSVSPNSKVLAYRYSGCNDRNELELVATRIWESRKEPQVRYEIVFPPAYFDIGEGYRIHISDALSGLPASDTGYGVKDVEITEEHIKVGIGNASMTIFDLLNERLSIIDGNIMSYETVPYNTSTLTITCSNNKTTYGATVETIVSIDKSTVLGDFVLYPRITGEVPKGGNFFKVFASTCRSEPEWLITPTEPLIVSGKEVLLEEWFPWTWDYVDIEVHFIFDPENTDENSTVKMTCKWISPDDSEMYTTENGMVQDYGYTTSSSAYYSTAIHRWFINSSIDTPYSYPYIKFEPNGNYNIGLKDLLVRMAIFYKPTDEYVPIEATFKSGVIEMRFKYGDDNEPTYSEWITIYDSENPNDYVNMMINVEEYVPNITLDTTKKFTLQFRAKGEGTASVYCEGSYSAFDELTKVIKYA